MYPRIRDLREDADLTQEQLVARLGMHKTTYTNLNREGGNRPLSLLSNRRCFMTFRLIVSPD